MVISLSIIFMRVLHPFPSRLITLRPALFRLAPFRQCAVVSWKIRGRCTVNFLYDADEPARDMSDDALRITRNAVRERWIIAARAEKPGFDSAPVHSRAATEMLPYRNAICISHDISVIATSQSAGSAIATGPLLAPAYSRQRDREFSGDSHVISYNDITFRHRTVSFIALSAIRVAIIKDICSVNCHRFAFTEKNHYMRMYDNKTCVTCFFPSSTNLYLDIRINNVFNCVFIKKNVVLEKHIY